METPIAYIPTDRRLALAAGQELPERCAGAALFADISGFTPLTEALVQALGAQRGAEELPQQLNRVYDALVAEVDRFRGSVLGFAGDAITCWFDEQVWLAPGEQAGSDAPAPAVQRAAACALALQVAMQPFAAIAIPGVGTVSLAIKVAVAAGAARRFIVGDPAIQLMDVLAGDTLQRLAAAEHLANKGDVMLDEAAVAALGPAATIREWRFDDSSGTRAAVLRALTAEVAPLPWPPFAPALLDEEQARQWLLPPVYERLHSGLGEFLTELRPAVALFLRFGGINYDGDPEAREKLDRFIRWVQGVLARYGGSMLQLTIGDKGSFLYAAFGAPLAYEDNAARAAGAALELRVPPPELAFIGAVQIGISEGRMRTGAYGGTTRRTYGVLGDEVNLAARLMQHAPPGQIYANQAARKPTADAFSWEELPPLRVKGKAQPVLAYRLLGAQERRAIRLQEPRYALPMVGRVAELARITSLAERARQGFGQIVGISAEAGLGKSRLVAEVVRVARREGFVPLGGEAQAYGTNTSYLAWQNIWRGFFGLDPSDPIEDQALLLEAELTRISPALLPRLPLLGAVLNLALPETELTSGLDPKLRKASLEALLVDCLRARAAEVPLLLVLEDCHWLDALSHDLLEAVARAIATMPVLIVMAYRPPQLERLLAPRVTRLSHFTEFPLGSLSQPEIEDLLTGKVIQLYGMESEPPPELVAQIGARAQGNPFYVEELLNYLHDRGVDPRDPTAVRQIELPTSIHSLILSRIDQLSENQKSLLKVASVIGRLFQAAMLWGVYTFGGDEQRVRADLDVLSSVELTPLDQPDPELTYLFKHVITQEVAYESLPFATRALIHDQIGQYIERTYPEALEQRLDLLAYHYGRSTNVAKQREYLRRAGEAAQADYANLAALTYFTQALPLLSGSERVAVLLRLGQVRETIGEWPEADTCYRGALETAEAAGDAATLPACRIAVGELLRRQGRFAEAAPWYEQAGAESEALGDQAGVAKALICAGTLAAQQGDLDTAQARYEASLAIRRALDDQLNIANVLNNMCIVAAYRGDLQGALALQRESLAIRRQLGNRWALGNSLNNMGSLLEDVGDLDGARAHLEEAIAIQREIGDQSAIALTLHSLGNLQRRRGDYSEALKLYRESCAINLRIGDRWTALMALEDIAMLWVQLDDAEGALQLAGAAARLREAMSAPLSPADQARLDAALASARAALGDAATGAWEAGRALDFEQAVALARVNAA